jgi:cyclase
MTGGPSAVRMNDRHSFPVGGLVELSRATYQSTPLAVVEIRPTVFSFIGAGGTVTAVGGSQECAVIDTGYGPRVPEIRSAIAWALHQSPRWLIDTHWHFDHTDGNSTFAGYQTTVVGHANCRARMSQDQFVPSLEWSVRSSPRSAWPVLTFNAAVSIDLGSQTLELIPQEPAHTDGDVVVWLPSANVLVMGDLMTNGSYPVIDESSCGSLHGMIQAIERLLPFINAETAVVPGHGPIANRDDLVNFHDTLGTIEGRVQHLIAAGSSVAEILAAAPSAEFDPVWGRGYVTGTVFVRMILAGLGLIEKPR